MPSNTRLECLACPHCRADVTVSGAGWACSRCAAPFPRRSGWIDFAPATSPHPGLAQRFMESRTVAGIYEGVFRPALTRLGSHIGYAQEQAFLEEHVSPSDGPALDLGCGTGRYAGWLARRIGATNVIGLDISAPMLDKAVGDAQRNGWSDVLFVRGSAMSLPIKPACLGAVTCFGALHLFPDPSRAVAAIALAMRPRAALVCMTTSRMTGFLQTSAQHMTRRTAAMRFFDEADLIHLLSQHGLAVTAVRRDRMVVMIAARKETPQP